MTATGPAEPTDAPSERAGGRVAVVVPTWNGLDHLDDCLDSLLDQSLAADVIVVDNASNDGTAERLHAAYPTIVALRQPTNLGFAGGVNVGIRHALAGGAQYVALLNDDAVVHRDWLAHLVTTLEDAPDAGIATCKLLTADRERIDSTGAVFSAWGVTYQRGWGESAARAPSAVEDVFGASAAATLYRSCLFEDIGLFDEDLFAYLEDTDICLRARLAGWRTLYVPTAEAYHQGGATSRRIRGNFAYRRFRNTPLVLVKDIPAGLLPMMLVRFVAVHLYYLARNAAGGVGGPAVRGVLASPRLMPRKLAERRHIQARRRVPVTEFRAQLASGLPPRGVARLRAALGLRLDGDA